MKKNKVILLILLIIILLFAFYVTYLYINKNKTFKFKKFSYYIPENITFKVVSDDEFEIKGENLDAIIEPYVNTKGEIHSQDLMYTILLKEIGEKISQPIKETIENKQVLCYEETSKKKLLCYFDAFDAFAYEVTIKNSYDINDMKEIVHILLQGKYDYKSNKTYEYYESYEKLITKINEN